MGLMSPSYRGATAPTDAAQQAAAGIALAKGVVIAQTKTLLWGFPLFFFTGMPCTSKCLCQQGMGCKGKYTRRSEERKK